MTGFALLGAMLIAAIVGAGVYWVITNVTIKSQKDPYVYMKDENGNEYVKDNTNEKT